MIKANIRKNEVIISISGDNFEDLLNVMRNSKFRFSKSLGKVWIGTKDLYLIVKDKLNAIELIKEIENE